MNDYGADGCGLQALLMFLFIGVMMFVLIKVFPGQANSVLNPPPPAWEGCVSHPGHFITAGVVTEVTASKTGETIHLANGQSFLDVETQQGGGVLSRSINTLSVVLPSMAVGSRVTVHWDRNSPLCVFPIGSNHPTHLVTAQSIQASHG